jgi:hypothetical protein
LLAETTYTFMTLSVVALASDVSTFSGLGTVLASGCTASFWGEGFSSSLLLPQPVKRSEKDIVQINITANINLKLFIKDTSVFFELACIIYILFPVQPMYI